MLSTSWKRPKVPCIHPQPEASRKLATLFAATLDQECCSSRSILTICGCGRRTPLLWHVPESLRGPSSSLFFAAAPSAHAAVSLWARPTYTGCGGMPHGIEDTRIRDKSTTSCDGVDSKPNGFRDNRTECHVAFQLAWYLRTSCGFTVLSDCRESRTTSSSINE